MLADLDETLRQLLNAEIPIKNGEVDISFHQPKREWSARLTKPSINLFMYDIRENQVLRQHQWEDVPVGRPTDPQFHQRRSPFRVDCYYMLTTWAAEPDDEHRLMTRTMLALFRYPTLPENRLVGGLKNQPYEIQTHLASHDRLTNPAEVWSSLDNELRPTISYIVTLALDPWSEVTGPLVQTLTLRTGPTASLPWEQHLVESASASELIYIGGILSKKGTQQPLSDIEIAIKGTGLFTRTDQAGRFRLGALRPGEYSLVAWAASGKPQEKKISVPNSDGNYNFEIN
jgi:hypothetical protein